MDPRLHAAAVAYQRGLYHLFILKQDGDIDDYTRGLRTYAAVFQLCATHVLLDKTFTFQKLPGELRRVIVNDRPTRQKIDAAALVTHSLLTADARNGNRGWRVGFSDGHPLRASSELALGLFDRTVECRHTLLYRPFLLKGAGGYQWEDCPLMDLVEDIPTTEQIENAYTSFARAMRVRAGEIEEGKSADDFAGTQWSNDLQGNNGPAKFLYYLFEPFEDRTGGRPTESLLLSYGRLLLRNNDILLGKLRDYRNALLEIDTWRGKSGFAYFSADLAGRR